MRINECYIESFGKIRARSFSFSDGLHVVCEENEWGKSTLAAFLKAMFYGLGDTKKQKLDENERKRFLPWGGTTAGGSLTFTTKSGTFRIERTFAQKSSEDTAFLYDVKTGNAVPLPEVLGESLFGIDADGFERTVFFSEHPLIGKNDNKSIAAKLSDLVGTDGDIGQLDEAMRVLEDERKHYYKKGGRGELFTLETQISDLTQALSDLERAKEEGQVIAEQLLSVKERIATLSAKKAALDREIAADATMRETDALHHRYEEARKKCDTTAQALHLTDAYFERRLPSVDDLREAERAHQEARAIRANLSESRMGEEYLDMKTFFRRKTEFGEIYRMRELYETAEARRKNAAIGSTAADTPEFERLREKYEQDAPSEETVRGDLSLLEAATDKQRRRTGMLVAAIALVAAAVLLLIFGLSTIAIVLFAPAILLIAIALIGRTENLTELHARLDRYVPRNGTESDKERLLRLESELRAFRTMKREREETLKKQEAENMSADAAVREYIACYPVKDPGNVADALAEIQEKFTKYSLQMMNADQLAARDVEAMKRAAALEEKSQAFLADFPPLGDDPFGKLRELVGKRQRLQAELRELCEGRERLKQELDAMQATANTQKCAERIREADALGTALADEMRKQASIEQRAQYLNGLCADAEEKQAELEDLRQKKDRAQRQLDIIRQTQKYLKEASDAMTSRYLSGTVRGVESFMQSFTGEKDGVFSLNTSFEVSKIEGGTTRSTEAYSRATRDLHAIATRFALVGALYENEPPFLLLDDPFVALDDGRIKNALAVLKKIAHDKQIIYLTCSRSRCP